MTQVVLNCRASTCISCCQLQCSIRSLPRAGNERWGELGKSVAGGHHAAVLGHSLILQCHHVGAA